MENNPFFFMAARLNLTTKEGEAEGGGRGNEFMAIENNPCFPQAMKYTGAMDDCTSQDFFASVPFSLETAPDKCLDMRTTAEATKPLTRYHPVAA